MSQNTFCSKCHRTPNQCCCNTAPRELSDEEIMKEAEKDKYWDYEDFDFMKFARAILKKAQNK